MNFFLQEKLCHFWFNTFFLVEPKMQTILSDDIEKSGESNLGTLSSYLIPECGHKHLYTMIKKDIDGLHKDKLHRFAPSSFTVSSFSFVFRDFETNHLKLVEFIH